MVEDLDDDPYLAELLGLTKDDEPALGAGGKAKASSAAAASGSKASSSSVAAAQQSQSSPTKAPSYRSSDTHRETLKLLSQLSPSMAQLPSASDVRRAFQELYGGQAEADDDDVEGVDAARDEEKVQRALEEHLDVADLGPRMEVVREAMRRLGEAREECRRQQRRQEEEGEQGGGPGLSQSLSLSQASVVGDELSQANGNCGAGNNGGAKKCRRVAIPGGKSELPLVFPKGLVSVPEGGAVSKKGPKSLLVELDERDTGQDLTGDSGAVGRVHVSKKRGMVLDLKGHQYLAYTTRCPALLLVSIGEDEAKVEDAVEGLCVLTHLRDQLEAMGGQTVRAGEENGSCRGSDDDEDFGRWDAGSDADGGGKGKGKKKPHKKAVATVTSAASKPAAAAARKKGAGKGKGKGNGKKGGGGGRKSAAGAAKKKAAPKKVSLKALKPSKGKGKQRKGSDDDEEEEEEKEEEEEEESEESFSEADDDSDSDFSI